MKTWNSFFLSFFLFLIFHLPHGNAVSLSVLATEEILMDQSKSEDEVKEILNWIEESEDRKEKVEPEILQRAFMNTNIFDESSHEFERRLFILKELLLKGPLAL